jgi:hypothetical protein
MAVGRGMFESLASSIADTALKVTGKPRSAKEHDKMAEADKGSTVGKIKSTNEGLKQAIAKQTGM